MSQRRESAASTFDPKGTLHPESLASVAQAMASTTRMGCRVSVHSVASCRLSLDRESSVSVAAGKAWQRFAKLPSSMVQP